MRDYHKYLSPAQVKRLSTLQSRYDQLQSDERATFAKDLADNQRAYRNHLANMGLASRPGNIISGLEKTAGLNAQTAYRSYSNALTGAATPYVDAAGVRMAQKTLANKALADRQKAYQEWGIKYSTAKAEAEKKYQQQKQQAEKQSTSDAIKWRAQYIKARRNAVLLRKQAEERARKVQEARERLAAEREAKRQQEQHDRLVSEYEKLYESGVISYMPKTDEELNEMLKLYEYAEKYDLKTDGTYTKSNKKDEKEEIEQMLALIDKYDFYGIARGQQEKARAQMKEQCDDLYKNGVISYIPKTKSELDELIKLYEYAEKYELKTDGTYTKSNKKAEKEEIAKMLELIDKYDFYGIARGQKQHKELLHQNTKGQEILAARKQHIRLVAQVGSLYKDGLISYMPKTDDELNEIVKLYEYAEKYELKTDGTYTKSRKKAEKEEIAKMLELIEKYNFYGLAKKNSGSASSGKSSSSSSGKSSSSSSGKSSSSSSMSHEQALAAAREAARKAAEKAKQAMALAAAKQSAANARNKFDNR